jgi:ribosomal protein S12 methylthiotransferase accessory factor YcaO
MEGVRMHYELRLATTASGVGYFAGIPSIDGNFDDYLAYLRSCPLDDFMHRHLLEKLGELDEGSARKIHRIASDRDEVMLTLLLEAALTFEHLKPVKQLFKPQQIRDLMKYTPLINIKSALLSDQQVHAAWMREFDQNISGLLPLPAPASVALPNPFSAAELQAVSHAKRSLQDLGPPVMQEAPDQRVMLPSSREAAEKALRVLDGLGALASEEHVHQSSLSPHGFLRRWRLEISVKCRRHDYVLTGIQTSYGKGLREEDARASYAMEIVERFSSFASVGPDALVGYRKTYPLTYGSLSDVRAIGINVLDPNELRLEAPYDDEPLHWLEAQEKTAGRMQPILIPVQTVFLFCNLDEVGLFSGLGSTGLASGSTPEQAKLGGLLEVIERDCEATMPFHVSRCFRVTPDSSEIGELLADYEVRGIRVQFLDITHELGVPCYKCVVMGPRGGVVKGTGAHLEGRRALLSAMTETPYPYPGGPPSGPALEGLSTRRLEDLPTFGWGNPPRDLSLLEDLLAANGYRVIYVDLTREDVGIPVFKSIVPGLEFSADFDSTSRVSPRLFANYLGMMGEV